MPSKIKVLHLTTHDEECGIATYQQQFLEGLEPIEDIENDIFPYSPNQTKIMRPDELANVLQQFSDQLKNYDILHIQHEFSFYSHDELDKFVSEAKSQNKQVIITVHTSLDVPYPEGRLRGMGPSSLALYAHEKRLQFKLDKIHLNALKKADLILVHNQVTAESLAKRGVERSKITLITHPVPIVSFGLKTDEIEQALHRSKGDVIFCTVGFISENKGTKHAVRALSYLPDNYKLAIIGGAHPSGDNDQFYDELCDLILELDVKDRVYITGYVKDDAKLHALIRECDVCVYPFDRKYYAGVTSGSLNQAIANYKPAIAYPTKSIIEMNQQMEVIGLCESFSYYELARSLQHTDMAKLSEQSKRYAEVHTYDKEAFKLADIYRGVNS